MFLHCYCSVVPIGCKETLTLKCSTDVPTIEIRAVKVSALIYAINAIKYFNAVNATLFTSGVFPDTKPPRACSQSAKRDRVEDGES